MNDAEDRRVRADPEREREHDEERELRMLPKEAEREAKVLLRLAEPLAKTMRAGAPGGAPRCVCTKLVAVAETAKCFDSGFSLAHPERTEFVGTHVEVNAHLVGQLTRDAFRALRQLEEAAHCWRQKW
jgi:hypothetical protein